MRSERRDAFQTLNYKESLTAHLCVCEEGGIGVTKGGSYSVGGNAMGRFERAPIGLSAEKHTHFGYRSLTEGVYTLDG